MEEFLLNCHSYQLHWMKKNEFTSSWNIVAQTISSKKTTNILLY